MNLRMAHHLIPSANRRQYTAESVRRGNSFAAARGGNFLTILSSFADHRCVTRFGGGLGFVGGFHRGSFRNRLRRTIDEAPSPSDSAAARGYLLRTTWSAVFVH